MAHPDHKPARPLAEMPALHPTVLDHYMWLEPVEDEGHTWLVPPRSCDWCWEHDLGYLFESIDAALAWKAEWLDDELDVDDDDEAIAAIQAEADAWILVTIHKTVMAPDVLAALAEAHERVTPPDQDQTTDQPGG